MLTSQRWAYLCLNTNSLLKQRHKIPEIHDAGFGIQHTSPHLSKRMRNAIMILSLLLINVDNDDASPNCALLRKRSSMREIAKGARYWLSSKHFDRPAPRTYLVWGRGSFRISFRAKINVSQGQLWDKFLEHGWSNATGNSRPKTKWSKKMSHTPKLWYPMGPHLLCQDKSNIHSHFFIVSNSESVIKYCACHMIQA